jgi:hypothetical protein
MKKYGLAAIVAVILAGSLGWVRLRATPDEGVNSGAQPPRPNPLDEFLSRPPAQIIAGETVRTRVADAPTASEKPVKELGGTDWAVVMAIYKDYGAAERRARNVAEGSAFKAKVFPSEGQGSKYMVVLESGLKHGKALQLRERAVSGGLPGDTYVTRLGPRE